MDPRASKSEAPMTITTFRIHAKSTIAIGLRDHHGLAALGCRKQLLHYSPTNLPSSADNDRAKCLHHTCHLT